MGDEESGWCGGKGIGAVGEMTNETSQRSLDRLERGNAWQGSTSHEGRWRFKEQVRWGGGGGASATSGSRVGMGRASHTVRSYTVNTGSVSTSLRWWTDGCGVETRS